MEKLSELFDSILFLTLAYPATLFNTVFFPQRVYGPKKAFLTCPVSVTLVISFSIAYLAASVLDRIRYSANLPLAFPTTQELEFWLAVLISISLVLSMALAAVRCFGLQSLKHTPTEEMLALSYPISVALATMPIVLVICLAVPDFAISVAPVDKEYIQRLPEAFATRGGRFAEAVPTLAYLLALFLSGVTLFNAFRTIYRANWKKSLAATLAIFVCTALLIMGIVSGLDYLTASAESLKEKSLQPSAPPRLPL